MTSRTDDGTPDPRPQMSEVSARVAVLSFLGIRAPATTDLTMTRIGNLGWAAHTLTGGRSNRGLVVTEAGTVAAYSVSQLTPDEALARLEHSQVKFAAAVLTSIPTSFPAADVDLMEATRMPGGWTATYRRDTDVPAGSPSYLVLDDGVVEAVDVRETFADALNRVRRTQPPNP